MHIWLREMIAIKGQPGGHGHRDLKSSGFSYFFTFRILLAITLLLAASAAQKKNIEKPYLEQGFVSLFNGRDLTRWVVPAEKN